MNISNVSLTSCSMPADSSGEVQPSGAGFSDVLAQRLPRVSSLDDAFLSAGRMYNVSPALLKAVAATESGFNADAVSPAGAVGLMQIMPATARQLGIDPSNSTESIQGAAKYLRMLLNQFNGNETLAIAAYNAGPGAVAKYDGIPPYKETQDYVARVANLLKQYSSGADSPSSSSSNVANFSNPGVVYEDSGAYNDSASQSSVSDLAELLLLWTATERAKALSSLNSDDLSGQTTMTDPVDGSLDLSGQATMADSADGSLDL